jgi:hypothetical protein
MCNEDSEVIALQNSSQQTQSSATVKTPFGQCRAIRHSGTSHSLSSTAPLRLYKQTNKHCCCTGDASQSPILCYQTLVAVAQQHLHGASFLFPTVVTRTRSSAM